MREQLKWQIWELKRLHRLWIKPEQSAVDLCRTVGIFWLWRRHAKREYKVYPWKDRREFYALDLAMPSKRRGVEADGVVHLYTQHHDIIRDQRLTDMGWTIMRVSTEELRRSPRKIKRKVRKFLK